MGDPVAVFHLLNLSSLSVIRAVFRLGGGAAFSVVISYVFLGSSLVLGPVESGGHVLRCSVGERRGPFKLQCRR